MSGVAEQVGVGQQVRRERLVRVVLAVLLLGGWLTWAASTYQSQLRIVPTATFHDDLAAGRVVAFRAATNVRHDRVWAPNGTPDMVDLPATNEDGTFIRRDGMSFGPPPTVVYWTEASVGPVRVLDANDSQTPSADLAIQELRDAGVPPADLADVWPSDQADLWGMGTALLALLAVVFGPAPTRGTRWFWFWLLGVTWGLGVVAYAVCELVRPRQEPRVARGAVTVERVGPEGGPATVHELGEGSGQRARGWLGLVAGFVASAVLLMVFDALSRGTGGVWLPLP